LEGILLLAAESEPERQLWPEAHCE
jgi:hypothetical protein